jgi:hypothetical protein
MVTEFVESSTETRSGFRPFANALFSFDMGSDITLAIVGVSGSE